MHTYKSEHTGERVDNAVTKIPEGLPTEDSFIVVKANGSASGYVPQSQISSNKLDKQTAQTTSDQIYGKLADGSQTMFDVTMGATATTIPRRDTAGRIQVADGVSGNDAVNFKQLSAVESSVINSLDKEHIAYVNKENTFTEPQTFSYVNSDDPNWSEYAELGGDGANYSYTEYTDDTHKYSTSGEAYISSFVGRVMVGRSTIDEKGVSRNSIVLDVRKNWIARTEINAERVDGELGPAVQTYYAYKFPKTYPNKEVTLATIEDLTAQFGALNIQNGSGIKSIQQVKNTDGTTIPIKTKNPNAVAQGAPEEVEIGATGESAAVFGGAAAATAKRAFAAGTNTAALGKYSAAFGDNSVALGNESFVANSVTTASGQGASAFGNSTIASGYNSFAEGNSTIASGQVSHAAGTGTKATSNNQFVIGKYNAEDDNAIFIIGIGTDENNRINGFLVNKNGVAYSNGKQLATNKYVDNSTEFLKSSIKDSVITQKLNVGRSDNNNVVSQGASAAIGVGLNTNAYAQTVLGRYNKPDEDAFFIVGNGTPENIQNAFEVLKDGRAKVQSAPQDNDDVVRKLELDRKLDKTGGIISGSLIIAENLMVQGKTTSVDTQNLKVADKLIYVAKDNTIALTSPAGLITPKYDGTNNGGIVYDHTGTAYVGDITLDGNGNVDVNNSDLQPIATRNATITNGNLVKWDSENLKLVDAGKNVENLVDKLAASLRNQAYVRNANGEDGGLAYTYTDEGNTLALRNASGQLQVSDPSQDKDAANKSYADNLNARYVSTSILGG